MKDLGQKIATLRKQKNLSQEELAEKLGVSRQAISKWERNESMPDVYNLVNIADALEVSLDSLIKEKEQESINKFQKVPLLLMGIPAFLLLMAWVYGFLVMVGTSFGLVTSFFDLADVPGDVYSRMIIAILASMFIYIYLISYKHMFTGKNIYKSYVVYLVVNAMLLVGHLMILLIFYLHTFSMIFLYILVLLILVSGIVGVLLFDVNKEKEERYSGFNKAYKKFEKPLAFVFVGFIVLTGLSIIQNRLLIEDMGYVDEMTLVSNDWTDNMFYLRSFEQEGQNQIQYETTIKVTKKFHVELETKPIIKIYIEDVLFTEGQMISKGNMLYSFDLNQLDDQQPMLIVDDQSSNEHIDIRVEIIWNYNGQDMISIEDIEYTHYELSFSYMNQWIWNVNKYKNENIVIK